VHRDIFAQYEPTFFAILVSIYFSNWPLHVSSRLTAHHQEVLFCTYSDWYVSCWT